jgi:hypothetical protein
VHAVEGLSTAGCRGLRRRRFRGEFEFFLIIILFEGICMEVTIKSSLYLTVIHWFYCEILHMISLE